MNLDLFHSLTNKNIEFKPLSTCDVQEIHEYASDPIVSQYIGWKLMNTLDETREFIDVMINRELEGTHLYASVVQKSSGFVIGTAMLFNFDHQANKAEIGYVFHKDYWGKGYGTQVISLISDFAFKSLKLHKLHGQVVHPNIGSARILEKNDFKLEGRLIDHYFIDNDYYDALLYGKINNK